MVLLVGKTGLSSPFVELSQKWSESSHQLRKVLVELFLLHLSLEFVRRTSTCNISFRGGASLLASKST